MKYVTTEIEIEAPAEKVWKIFTDFARNSEWNMFMPKITGNLRTGESLKVHLHIPNEKKEMVFKATLLNVEENKELCWLGKLAGGMFRGKRKFVIESINEKRVRFIHSEQFDGILVGFMTKKIDNARIGFEEMNQQLKVRCEK